MYSQITTLLTVASLGLAMYLSQRFVSWWLDRTTADFRYQLDEIADSTDTLLVRLPPSVFLKPIGDEAALALTWANAMAALMQATSSLLFLSWQWARDSWYRVPRIPRIIGGVLLITAWGLGTSYVLTLLAIESLPDTMLAIREHFGDSLLSIISLTWALCSWTASLLIILAFVVIILVALLAAVGAGMPSLKTALYLRISIEAIPVGSHRLVLVDVLPATLPSSTRVAPSGLSHSALYNSPGAIHAVMEALKGFETARATTSP